MEKFLGTNWKTTLVGMPSGLAGLASTTVGLAALFHISIPGVTVTGDPMTMIQAGIPMMTAGLVGYLAKDKDVTGGTRQQ